MSPLMTASLMSPFRRRILAMVASVYWSMDPAMMVYSYTIILPETAAVSFPARDGAALDF